MIRQIVAASAATVLLAACTDPQVSRQGLAATSPSPSTTPTTPSGSPSPSPTSTAAACITSAQMGECPATGDYNSYPGINGVTGPTAVGNNMWNPIPGATSTLTAYDPGNWSIKANMPAGNTDVVSYPSVGTNWGLGNQPNPITNFSSIISTFSENMHATAGTSAWAAWDIWTNSGTSFNNPGNEVMIQTDFAGNGPCTYAAVQQFGGSSGVPVQTWGLCDLGTELVWKLAPAGTHVGDSATINESSGSADILAMLTWLMNKGYMATDSGLGQMGYGWEIASTAGQYETFQVSGFTLHTTCAASHPCS